MTSEINKGTHPQTSHISNFETFQLTDMSDIYSANVGDKIVLDKNVTIIDDIYAEALVCNKWVSVLDHPIHCTYVIEILDPTTIKNKIVTTQVIGGKFLGLEEEGRASILLPGHINSQSLLSKFRTMTDGYTFTCFEDYLIVTLRSDSFSRKFLLTEFNEGDIKTVNKRECANVKSTISLLYRIASELGITVRVRNKNATVEVTHMGVIDTTVTQTTFTSQLNEWLNTMPYDLTVSIPTKFIEAKSLAYINTVVNKSKFNCKCRAGRITKMSSCLKKTNGTVLVCVKENVVKVINKPSLTHLNSKDRKLINLSLLPYKLTYEDVR
jgi:hypothetical protein